MSERRIRIGEWLLPYDDATQEVRIERTLSDIFNATPGSDTDCMNSQCIRAQRNSRVFPHPVYLVSTIKSRVYIVDQLDESGEPSHAIRYELSARDGKLISEHDRMAAGEPGELRLRVPRQPKGTSHGGWLNSPGGPGNRTWSGSVKRPVDRGASARFKVAVGAFRLGSDA